MGQVCKAALTATSYASLTSEEPPKSAGKTPLCILSAIVAACTLLLLSHFSRGLQGMIHAPDQHNMLSCATRRGCNYIQQHAELCHLKGQHPPVALCCQLLLGLPSTHGQPGWCPSLEYITAMWPALKGQIACLRALPFPTAGARQGPWAQASACSPQCGATLFGTALPCGAALQYSCWWLHTWCRSAACTLFPGTAKAACLERDAWRQKPAFTPAQLCLQRGLWATGAALAAWLVSVLWGCKPQSMHCREDCFQELLGFRAASTDCARGQTLTSLPNGLHHRCACMCLKATSCRVCCTSLWRSLFAWSGCPPLCRSVKNGILRLVPWTHQAGQQPLPSQPYLQEPTVDQLQLPPGELLDMAADCLLPFPF